MRNLLLATGIDDIDLRRELIAGTEPGLRDDGKRVVGVVLGEDVGGMQRELLRGVPDAVVRPWLAEVVAGCRTVRALRLDDGVEGVAWRDRRRRRRTRPRIRRRPARLSAHESARPAGRAGRTARRTSTQGRSRGHRRRAGSRRGRCPADTSARNSSSPQSDSSIHDLYAVVSGVAMAASLVVARIAINTINPSKRPQERGSWRTATRSARSPSSPG